jgi:hypothetical protein
MRKITLLVAMVTLCITGYAQTGKAPREFTPKKNVQNLNKNSFPVVNIAAPIFSDDMNGDNSPTGLAARGYTTYWRGAGTQPVVGVDPDATHPWYQGDPVGWINSFNGPDSGYVNSDYFSVLGANDADNWLVLPAQNVAAGDSFSFWAATVPQTAPAYVDSIIVMYNPTGATLPEDLNWVELARFELDWVTGAWTRYSYAIPATSATGVLAIRSAVPNSGPSGSNGYFVGVDQIDVFNNVSTGNFDDCAAAIDINTSFGGGIGVVNTIGPYDNTLATVDPNDPTAGWECYGEPDGQGTAPELNNNVWFTFVGDGNNYFVESGTCAGVTNYIDDGDTQFSLYSGTCGALTPLKCNEDGPSATAVTYPAGFSFGTAVGVTYYLMVDGFSFNGAVSTGEFCLLISQIAQVACADTGVNSGAQTQNALFACPGDTITFTTSGAVSPNVGDYSGIGWVISTGDISGSTDPINEPTFFTSYGFVSSPVPANSIARIVNGQIADGTYYWTPVVFGNATAAAPGPQFLQDLTLDPACTFAGTSMLAQLVPSTDPLCIVGVSENLPGTKASIIAYPSPAADLLNVDFTSAEKQNTVIEVSDYTGRVVLSQAFTASTGVNKVQLNVKSLSSGAYLVSLKNEGSGRNVKFVKQ